MTRAVTLRPEQPPDDATVALRAGVMNPDNIRRAAERTFALHAVYGMPRFLQELAARPQPDGSPSAMTRAATAQPGGATRDTTGVFLSTVRCGAANVAEPAAHGR